MNIPTAPMSTISMSIQPVSTQVKTGDTPVPDMSRALSASHSLSASITSVSTSIIPAIPTANPTYEKPTMHPISEGEPSQIKNEAITEEVGPKSSSEEGDELPELGNNDEEKEVSETKKQNGESYSEAELELISSLKIRDAEVNAHERAHAAVGGQHAGSPNYSYKTGPDGVKYAVSGEVSIDTSRVSGDPQATLQKAQQIKAAALAPAEPSGQDRKVAAKADQMAAEARNDILNSNNAGEDENRSTASQAETSVPEHFTGAQYAEMNDSLDSSVQKEMHQRNVHINEIYNNTRVAHPPSHVDIQV